MTAISILLLADGDSWVRYRSTPYRAPSLKHVRRATCEDCAGRVLIGPFVESGVPESGCAPNSRQRVLDYVHAISVRVLECYAVAEWQRSPSLKLSTCKIFEEGIALSRRGR
jgi:hypothetical protein